jgi:ferredoxin-NADP reductase
MRSIWSRVADVVGLVATPLAPSHYLKLVDPLRATHVRSARVESVWDETEDARTLTLRPGAGWRRHRAGQYVRIAVDVDGRQVTRTYSISSSPDRADGLVTITVKIVPGGRASRTLARIVRPGDYLTIGLPQGDFVLPEGPPVRSLFITGGSGITPVMSMLRTFAARDAMPDVAHVHYAPRMGDVIFARELAELAAAFPSYRLAILPTREPGLSGVPAERFAPASLDACVPDWREREAWACGPEGLLDAVESAFATLAGPRRLHVERFRAKLAALPEGAGGGRVRFGLSRRDVESDGRTSLLAAAERAGVSAPHGCRMGICHSCDATMISGCVRDLRTGKTITEPGARVQVCVCAAAGDVEIAL